MKAKHWLFQISMKLSLISSATPRLAWITCEKAYGQIGSIPAGQCIRRWTGNANLSDDIVTADQFYDSAVKAELDSTLVEYYRTEYPKMNWRIHSGVAAFLNQPRSHLT